MKCTATASILREALNGPRSVCSAGASQVAHTGVLLRTDGSTLTVCGTDGEVAVVSRSSVTVDADGEALVPPRPLIALLDGVAPATPVSLEAADSTLTIRFAKASPYRLRTLTATFPPPIAVTTPPLPVNLAGLDRAVTAVRSATGPSPAGVQIVSSAAGLRLAATDGYRLHVVDLGDGGFGDFSAVVSLPVLEQASRARPHKVAVDGDGKVIAFSGDRVSISARLLATPFPAISAVLADHPDDLRLEVTAAALRAALGRLVALGSTAPVLVEVADSQLRLSAADAEIGEGSEDVQVISGGNHDTIRFAADRSFLADAASAHGDATVTLVWRGAEQPVRLRSGDAKLAITTVVMPVKL
jgi:DNA polymerase III sliding clamp (beta) subunit (PCNA family)